MTPFVLPWYEVRESHYLVKQQTRKVDYFTIAEEPIGVRFWSKSDDNA